MRRGHFTAFRPHCPHCAASGWHELVLARVAEADGEDVRAGILLCPNPGCAHEYPIIAGIPVIVPDLRALLAGGALDLMLRDDIDADLESLLGDAIGPDSWFDGLRQTLSTYGWDGWADLDPAERQADADAPLPGAVRRCLGQLLALAGPAHQGAPAARMLDLGCGAGRTAFDLAAMHDGALVLGCDRNLGLLRLAQAALRGSVSYPRRRIGLVYDRRRFPVDVAGAARVDFWACDATALPFAGGGTDLVAALNLLDCVPDPPRLLASLADALAPGGRLLLATPYDWATRATPVEAWLGGHSQRGPYEGSAEPLLRALLTEAAHARSVSGLRLLGERTAWPWHTRLHDRSAVRYSSHLLALERMGTT